MASYFFNTEFQHQYSLQATKCRRHGSPKNTLIIVSGWCNHAWAISGSLLHSSFMSLFMPLSNNKSSKCRPHSAAPTRHQLPTAPKACRRSVALPLHCRHDCGAHRSTLSHSIHLYQKGGCRLALKAHLLSLETCDMHSCYPIAWQSLSPDPATHLPAWTAPLPTGHASYLEDTFFSTI